MCLNKSELQVHNQTKFVKCTRENSLFSIYRDRFVISTTLRWCISFPHIYICFVVCWWWKQKDKHLCVWECVLVFFFFWLLLDLSSFSLAVRKYLDVSGEAGWHFAFIFLLVTAEPRLSDDVNLKVIDTLKKMGFSVWDFFLFFHLPVILLCRTEPNCSWVLLHIDQRADLCPTTSSN